MITIRLATEDDWDFTQLLRNSSYEGSYQQIEPIPWGVHEKWNANRPTTWRNLIVEHTDKETLRRRRVGIITVGQLEHWQPEIGYIVNPTDQGHGFATEAVRLTIQWLRDSGYDHCHTSIKDDNLASIAVIKKNGFTHAGPAREGESWYQLRIHQEP